MVKSHAEENGFALNVVFEKKKYWETNYIFEIHKIESPRTTHAE
jgi:hypothetical protein